MAYLEGRAVRLIRGIVLCDDEPAIKVDGTIARVAALEKVPRKMRNGESFAFTALGTNVCEKRGDRWLIVHHHASKAAEHLTS